MNFLTIGLDEEIPNCQMCGNKPRLICKTLDTKRGETVRVFLCKCGETTKLPTIRISDRLEHDPEKWEPVFRKDHAQTKEASS